MARKSHLIEETQQNRFDSSIPLVLLRKKLLIMKIQGLLVAHPWLALLHFKVIPMTFCCELFLTHHFAVLHIVSKEVTVLFSITNTSLLRKTEKANLEKFDFELVCNEWRERAPLFYSFLLTSCINKKTPSSIWFGSLALPATLEFPNSNWLNAFMNFLLRW